MLFSIKNNRYHSFCQNCKHSSVINIYCVPKKHRNLLRSLISLKLVWEMFFHVKYVMLITTNYNNIIHIQNEINASLARMTIEYRMVVFTTDHTKMLHTFTTLRNLPNQDRRYCLKSIQLPVNSTKHGGRLPREETYTQKYSNEMKYNKISKLIIYLFFKPTF